MGTTTANESRRTASTPRRDQCALHQRRTRFGTGITGQARFNGTQGFDSGAQSRHLAVARRPQQPQPEREI